MRLGWSDPTCYNQPRRLREHLHERVHLMAQDLPHRLTAHGSGSSARMGRPRPGSPTRSSAMPCEPCHPRGLHTPHVVPRRTSAKSRASMAHAKPGCQPIPEAQPARALQQHSSNTLCACGPPAALKEAAIPLQRFVLKHQICAARNAATPPTKRKKTGPMPGSPSARVAGPHWRIRRQPALAQRRRCSVSMERGNL